MPAFAEDQGLRLDLECKGVRSNAPILARITLTYGGSRLLEGRLNLVLRSAGEVLATCRTHEMTLASGEKAFDLLLPICGSALRDNELEVLPSFVTERGAIKLQRVMRLLPESWERSCVVAASRLRADLGESGDRMMSRLGLDQFRPKLPEGSRRSLLTQWAGFAPEDMPEQPLAYCAFDLVFLAGKGFAFLREPQLDAIARWVRAGGSACVVPTGVLQPRHVKFLNGLADRDVPLFRLDAAGRLVAAEPPHVRGNCDAYLLRPCLGRTVVITAPPGRDHDYSACPQWRSILAFLWKARAEQLPNLLKDGKWRSDLEKDPDYSGPYAIPAAPAPGEATVADSEGFRDADLEARVGVSRSGGLAEAGLRLMPEGVQRISFGAVILVLALFVLLIGPVDYFLLGLLRVRKLTWLFLPVVAGLFTFFMVRLSEHYMGMQDRSRAVTVVDVDRKGRAVRQSRFELLFPGRERTLAVPLKGSLLHLMQYGHVGGSASRRRGPSYLDEGIQAGGDPTLCYEGSVLGQSTVAHKVRQWSPVLYRTFSLEPPEHAMDIQWDAVGVRDFADAVQRRLVAEKLLRGRAPSACVALFHGRVCHTIRGSPWDHSFLAQPMGGRRETVLQSLCANPQFGLFSIVSQISPTGGMHFEDMALYDPTDPAQWLLVVVEPVGDDLYVYRRLYREESASPTRKPSAPEGRTTEEP